MPGPLNLGLAAVQAAPAVGPSVAAQQAAPLDPRHIAALRRDIYKPADYDPETDRHYTYTKALPGDKFEIFKRRNQELDPLATILCAGQKFEIGDNIQMCVDPTKVHIVIYRSATVKGIEILVKKLRFHVKQMTNASLGEYGIGTIYSAADLRRKKPKEIAIVLFRLLKKRGRLLRLVVDNSTPNGPLSQPWMHKPGAISIISKA
jgi:hypothetical protein